MNFKGLRFPLCLRIPRIPGDIGIGLQGAEWIWSMASRFKGIVYVAGNHEFYKGNYTQVRKDLDEFSWPDNVHYLNGGTCIIGDIRFIGTTLWTDNDRSDPMFAMYVNRQLNDYTFIRYGQNLFRPEHSAILHAQDRENIVTHLSRVKENEKVVVVSHHLPSYQCVHKDYRGNKLNSAYASNLDDIIYYYKPILWLFGHSHKTCDIEIGSTHMRSNPRGYVEDSRGENPEFDPYLRIM